ncbi:MAG: arylsulfotransferase family protein [SAR324 cluster bacterium]|nr:arylsulfotransferase family protein [SAR324 cluster bacterium]
MDRSKFTFVLSLTILVGVVCFAWGWFSVSKKLFPAPTINYLTKEVSNFLAGGEGESNLTVKEKLQNDFGLVPKRQLVSNELNTLSFDSCTGLQSKFKKKAPCYFFKKRKLKKGLLASTRWLYLAPGSYTALIQLSIEEKPGIKSGYVEILSQSKSIKKLEFNGTNNQPRLVRINFEITTPGVTSVKTQVTLNTNIQGSIKELKIQKNWDSKVTREYKEILFDKDMPKHMNPKVFIKKNSPFKNGYIAILAAVDGSKGLHGIHILNGAGSLINTFQFNDKEEDFEKRIKKKFKYKPIEQRFPHGFAILPNGDFLLHDGDPGNSTRRLDWCGNNIWTVIHQGHHSIAVEDGKIYHWDGEDIFINDLKTGALVRSIATQQIVDANLDVGVFKLYTHITSGKVLYKDRYHHNDVEPLPKKYAAAFPQFNAGDLLVSFRNMNLVAVIDKNTLKLKWWSQGLTTRQHDPDWQPNGTITIFDNKMAHKRAFGATDIVSIDPKTNAYKILYSGKKDAAYAHRRGKHQITSDGSILMTFPPQGRVLAVDSKKEVFFEFINQYDKKKNLLVSEAVYLPPGYLNFNPSQRTCAK